MADTGANVLQLDVENMLVDDRAIAAQGVWHQVYTGAGLSGGGLASSDSVDDPDARYLTSHRMAWFFPYSDDEEPLLMGEIVYLHPGLEGIRKLAEGEEVFAPIDEHSFHL